MRKSLEVEAPSRGNGNSKYHGYFYDLLVIERVTSNSLLGVRLLTLVDEVNPLVQQLVTLEIAEVELGALGLSWKSGVRVQVEGRRSKDDKIIERV